jgi:predicted enzyme related to lactoylglutathione lyase
MSDWPRPVVHFQIQAKDSEKQREFYSEMFDWDIAEMEGSPFLMIPAGKGPPEEGLSGTLSDSETSGIMIFIQVANLGESLQKAGKLGGKATLQPVDVPNGPTIATIEDPEGNAVGLVQM